MDLKALINIDFQPLTLSERIANACSIFEQSTLSHIPVIENNVLVGNLSEDDCKTIEKVDVLAEYQYLLDPFFVRENTGWLNVLEAFAKNESNMMPIINKDNSYIGYYELTDILNIFNDTPFLNEPGSILVIEKNSKDQSFSEIVQIVESHNGKMLGAFISEIKGDRTETTLKIANAGINEILQTFRRYNYEIINGIDQDSYVKELKERSAYLNKYLNI
ncbi:hypothetical protein SAMN05216480_105195 [Pustulibacterium marinum]|uniref:CBS domain-containing protein n=1 Tax=Pustulibacterium marinum TaxID=1224947 RepID=A0A1I7GR32_9FLAO|nr:CBS domain-containing protein [Pustulibacterium marinum]SFU50897.1 hypothetical protein SAMN05216480_105195 [Pustulibacterium marinum]